MDSPNAEQAVFNDVPQNDSSQESKISDEKKNHARSKPRSSGSFLSKFQTSSTDKTDNPTIQSSIASAFSSLSSLTSNFTLNQPVNGENDSNALTIETASTSTKFSQSTDSKEDAFLKKATVERRNLINLTSLIVKDLISSSLSAGRTIDNCQNVTHLMNYFTLIEKVLKHGLKQNLLSNKSASLWSALESLTNYLKESTLISESVRSLAHTKTADGKIRAWMRLAMMQKKLPEYFTELLAHRNELLKDIYHSHAFMLNDEAHVFAGLIIGVNVIDCNFFVKNENFDYIDEIIDLGPYLKSSNFGDDDRVENDEQFVDEDSATGNLTKVLDQKNYLEERNKALESTIVQLRTQIKNLEEHNSRLEMEAKVNEARITKLQGASDVSSTRTITNVFKNLVNTSEVVSSQVDDAIDGCDSRKDESDETVGYPNRDDAGATSPTGQERSQEDQREQRQDKESPQFVGLEEKKKMEEELVGLRERISILETSYRGSLERIKALERDLDVQASMNNDRETTIKIYEKDLREKQTQVDSLRNSLKDSKKIYTEVNERLNDTSAKLKDRLKSVTNLQSSLDKWKLENKNLASELQDKQTALASTRAELEKTKASLNELKKYNEKINDDLKQERESGQSSSLTVETQTAQIKQYKERLDQLEQELNNVRPYREQVISLNKKCSEYEQSLEEIGSQLREARLELENFKENSAVFLDSQWMDSKQVKECALCVQSFSVTRRKHHCRLCGNVFCQTCSDNKMELASSSKPVRVCDTCHQFLLAKFVKTSLQ